ncbi:H-NS histone family protein [Allopseudospirillum japonicum]|uniref:H-NS histone family protein n=1 Tax=Allopseudospirillum japonicum TaxID=64971 RepID=A0A1H6QJ07_9GAMM|nr:H-NS family nucleoid-associated regulatory protein [Allopseudospirillum japonicum]SEI39460.1 H-NS histone family protein [Allopseudospirillum japonicum]
MGKKSQTSTPADFNEAAWVFANKNRLKGFLRRLSVSDLEKAKDAIEQVLDEQRQLEHQRLQEAERRKQKLQQIQAVMAQEGIQAEDLLAALNTPRKRGRPPKARALSPSLSQSMT